MKSVLSLLGAAALLAGASLPSQATVYQFNASLSQANELAVTTPNPTASGVATLFYDDKGTLSVTDDTYDFAMSVFSLTGPATAFHIHGAATTAQNGPVRIGLDNASLFTSFNSGGILLVGGNDVAVPSGIPATPANSFGAMSFLDMLQNQLAYVNVHTALNAPGEVRGQLVQVAAVPEPETYAMLLAGLGLVGWIGARRARKAS